MKPSPARLAWRTSPEIAALGREGVRPVALVPVGAVEQHGPHLATGTDAWLATAVAHGVAAEDPAVLVAEPVAYGSSAHHLGFAGTVSLRPSTLIAVLTDIGTCLWGAGLLPVFLNGHGGNRAVLQVAVTELGAAGVRSAAFAYFDLIAAEAAAILPDAATATGHACALETSLMMHLFAGADRPELVRSGGTPEGWPDPHLFAPAPVTVWRRFEEIAPDGVVGRPAQASTAAGARLFEAAVARSLETVQRLRDTYGANEP